MTNFCHLHVHSEFSLLDGLSRVTDLAKRAKELGMPAIALTDHGVMYGIIDFVRACKAEGVKAIAGLEIYIAPRRMTDRDPQKDKTPYHLVLLTENQTGYQNLLKIATAAQLEGFYYKPRVDKPFLAKHTEGIIALSSCNSGEVPRRILDGNMEEAKRAAQWYHEAFGADNFFLEIQNHEGIPETDQVNQGLVSLARELNIGLVATNDAHYVRAEDAEAQDILLCIQTGKVRADPDRMRMTDDSYYIKTAEEMAALFPEWPDALENTVRIAERCEVHVESDEYHLPTFSVPKGYTPETYLRRLTEEGFRTRYPDADEATWERLNYELGLIHDMGFDTYFLILWDLCEYAIEHDIWWNVRGSGAGSVVAYSLGITRLDPLTHDLIFERFLNPERVTMPDVDLDYPDDRRQELIDYTRDKYGVDKVANIITFGTLGARAAVRDVGRALDIPLNEVDQIAKLVPSGPKVHLKDAFDNPEFKVLYDSQEYVREWIDMAFKVEGISRHASVHAAGVVVTDKPMVEYIPLARAPKGSSDMAVTQFPMSVVESIGLLKLDFLGLATLTQMRKAAELIEARHGIKLDPDNIPTDDPCIFDLLTKGEVVGVFQVESGGMRKTLAQMRPTCLEDITAVVSLYRPGPMQFIESYCRRKHGEEKIEYAHPALEPILNETYGIIVYQEQIIRIMRDLAGYTGGQADVIRRAISKKYDKLIAEHRIKFRKGCEANNIPNDKADEIYASIEYFANYGFNKCLPGDVEVLDATSGRPMRIADLYQAQEHIEQTVTCDVNNLRFQTGRITAVLDNGVKPVYRLTTMLGRQIEATANHPFYTFAGWQRLDELVDGDRVAVPRRLPIEGQAEWPDYQVIVLGHLLAEGNLCHPTSVYYCTQSQAYLTDYVQAVEQFDNVKCSISLHKRTHTVYAKRIERDKEAGVVRWAKEMALWGKTACQKEIPATAFTLKSRQIALLLGRMWAGDGSLERQPRNAVHAYYATSSERLARQVQHLLLRLGMVSNLRKVVFPYKDGRVGYQVHVMGSEHIRCFAATVGQHLLDVRHREICARLLKEATSIKSTSARDTIPMPIKSFVRAEKVAAGITWIQMRTETCVAQREFYPTSNPGKRGFRRETIARLADYFDSTDLQRYANSDIYWDEVASIEYVGEKRTFDLSIAGTHNFVANDILVHNSHAADYAVITCQTAYLKAKYPVEYMAALLTVEQDNTDKVSVFLAECRRLGIPVLPPNVNFSDVDFTIEESTAEMLEAQHRVDSVCSLSGGAIRFGLGGIKNVSATAVQEIIRARKEGGPFASLDDFCERVDLRRINRRMLECLIKVGTLDRFGTRAQLLAATDQMMGVSTQVHHAQDVGQLTMFDMFGTGDQSAHSGIVLPDAASIPSKEMLSWEKELVGFYVSEHPLNQVAVDLQNTVTCFCGEIGEEMNGQTVVVAGIVDRIRPHITKKGDPMAFVHLEDIQGGIEVIVFPRTYAATRDLWQEDKILIVRGRVDAERREPKLICESVRDYVITARPEEEHSPSTSTVAQESAVPYKAGDRAVPSQNQITSQGEDTAGSRGNSSNQLSPQREPAQQPARRHLQITIQRTGDQEQDKQRVGQVYSLLQRYQGQDRFTFFVVNGKQRVQIDFPNATTSYTYELAQSLKAMLGRDALQLA